LLLVKTPTTAADADPGGIEQADNSSLNQNSCENDIAIINNFNTISDILKMLFSPNLHYSINELN